MILKERKERYNSWYSRLILDACLFFVTVLYTHTRLIVSPQFCNTAVPVYVCILEFYKRYNKLCYKRLCHCFNVRTRFTHNHLGNAGHLPDKALHYPTYLSLLPFYGYLPYTCETYSKRVQIGARDFWIRGTDYSSQVPLFKIGVPRNNVAALVVAESAHSWTVRRSDYGTVYTHCIPSDHHITWSTRARMRLLPSIGASEIVKMWLQLLSFHIRSEGVIKIYRRHVTPFLWELNLK